MPVSLHQVVTFATEPFRGNPASVVTLESPLPPPLLQELCAQLREPILAVIEQDGDEIGLRFVTPTGTHNGAGHATHAAAWVVLNRLRPGIETFAFRFDNGAQRSVRREDGLIAVDWPVMPYEPTNHVGKLPEALGRAPVETFQAVFGTVALFESDEDVEALQPDLARVAALDADTVIATAPGRRSDFVIRVFAPRLDLPEDPVCGTAHRIIVPLWAERLGRKTLVSHHLSPRTGELFCRLSGETVTIAGRARLFLDGTVDVGV